VFQSIPGSPLVQIVQSMPELNKPGENQPSESEAIFGTSSSCEGTSDQLAERVVVASPTVPDAATDTLQEKIVEGSNIKASTDAEHEHQTSVDVALANAETAASAQPNNMASTAAQVSPPYEGKQPPCSQILTNTVSSDKSGYPQESVAVHESVVAFPSQTNTTALGREENPIMLDDDEEGEQIKDIKINGSSVLKDSLEVAAKVPSPARTNLLNNTEPSLPCPSESTEHDISWWKSWEKKKTELVPVKRADEKNSQVESEKRNEIQKADKGAARLTVRNEAQTIQIHEAPRTGKNIQAMILSRRDAELTKMEEEFKERLAARQRADEIYVQAAENAKILEHNAQRQVTRIPFQPGVLEDNQKVIAVGRDTEVGKLTTNKNSGVAARGRTAYDETDLHANARRLHQNNQSHVYMAAQNAYHQHRMQQLHLFGKSMPGPAAVHHVPHISQGQVPYRSQQQPPQIFSQEIFCIEEIHAPVHLLLPREPRSGGIYLCSRDDALLTLLEVFVFAKRPRTSSYDADFTPVAESFRKVYMAKTRPPLKRTYGICCRGCKRDIMECRKTICSPSAVFFPHSPASFLQSLDYLRAHALKCVNVSYADKLFIAGTSVKQSAYLGTWNLSHFVKWYSDQHPYIFGTERTSRDLAAELRASAAVKQKEIEMEDIHQDLLDAVAGGFEIGQQAHMDYPLVASLLDIPFSPQYMDTPVSLVLLECFEVVLVRRDRMIECYKEELALNSFRSVAIIQCKYCHGENCNGGRAESAHYHAAGDGSGDAKLMTGGVMSVFYKHSSSCPDIPIEMSRKIQCLRPPPRTVRFVDMSRAVCRRLMDLNCFLESIKKRTKAQSDQEIWVAPSPKELGNIMRRYGRDAFTQVPQPLVTENWQPGCMVRDIEEFPRVGILHGKMSTDASTKCVLSKRKRSRWSDLSSKVTDEEVISAFELGDLAGVVSNKKANRSPNTAKGNEHISTVLFPS